MCVCFYMCKHTYVHIHIRVASKVNLVLLCWPTVSDVGVKETVEVEPFHQTYSITFYCHADRWQQRGRLTQ